MPQTRALLPDEQPEDDLAGDQRQQHPRLGRRRVHEPHESDRGVQKVRVQRAHVNGPHTAGLPPGRGHAGFEHHGGDERRVEVQAQAQVRPLRRRLHKLAHGGQFDRGEQVVVGVIAIALVAKMDLLGSLRDDAEGGIGHAVDRTGCAGRPVEVQALQRLDGPIFGNGPRDALGQLLPVDLRLHLCLFGPVCIPFVHVIHCTGFSCSLAAFFGHILQDRPIIFEDCYTAIRSQTCRIKTEVAREAYAVFGFVEFLPVRMSLR